LWGKICGKSQFYALFRADIRGNARQTNRRKKQRKQKIPAGNPMKIQNPFQIRTSPVLQTGAESGMIGTSGAEPEPRTDLPCGDEKGVRHGSH
jgi:hypothetical protein